MRSYCLALWRARNECAFRNSVDERAHWMATATRLPAMSSIQIYFKNNLNLLISFFSASYHKHNIAIGVRVKVFV